MGPRNSSASAPAARRAGARRLAATSGRSCTALAVVVAGLVAGASPAAADGCANAAVRSAQQAELPDCRAYEMVSPVDKAGFSVTRSNGATYANGSNPAGTAVLRGGDGFAYVGGGAVGDPQAQEGLGIPYRALRGADGWSSVPLNGPLGPPAPVLIGATWNPAISADGSRSILSSPTALVEGAWRCLETQIMCLSGNLYLQDNTTLERRLITGLAADGSEPLDGAQVAATTPDFDKVLVTSTDALTDDAVPGVPNLFAWTDDGSPRGELQLVGRDEHGQPLPDGAVAGQGREMATKLTTRTLSADGRRIFFSSAGQLYARLDGTTTVRVSASQRSTPDPDGPQAATYWTAEGAHGSAVFFTSGEKLTDDARATPSAPDLYRYDVDAERLTDLTAAGGPAGVLGVIGASDDAENVYFAATAELVPGKGSDGEANVYRWHDDESADGELGFVATVGSVAEATDRLALNWATGTEVVPPVAISTDGRFAALLSLRPLTATETNGTVQVYRYDARTTALACASCAPDGSRSTGNADFRQPDRSDAYRVVSDRGDVGFQTDQALLPADRNGQRDVYLYGDGGPRLISTGDDPQLSTFAGLSVSGGDVFFSTRSRLVSADVDDLADLYDARIDGGFAEAAKPAPCQADACQGRPSTGGGLADPVTASFAGPGNLAAPAPKRATRKLSARATATRSGRITVAVRVPAAGRIRITGATLRTATRSVRRAGKVTLRVRLAAKASRSLVRRHRLRVAGRVAFTPKRGKPSSTTVALTIEEKK